MKQEVHDDIPVDETHRFLLWQQEYDDTQGWARGFDKAGVPYLVENSGHGKWTIYKHMSYGPNGCRCLQRRGIIDMAVGDLVAPSRAKKLVVAFG